MARYAPLFAGVALMVAFLILNRHAWDGFFQDDELDTLGWAPLLPLGDFIKGFLTPLFATDNFRPTGFLYFHVVGSLFGLNFPPWITPLIVLHLANAVILYGIQRRLRIGIWHALASTSLFLLNAAVFEIYWKPMYVFDLLCCTFSLLCLLLWIDGRWILSFLAYWLAYKAKELAVMLPAVLLLYEWLLGARRWKQLIPFFAASVSFGIQGIVRNPNLDNAYTFRFNLVSLRATIPFYLHQFLGFRGSGLLLGLPLLFGSRRGWFALCAMLAFLFPLLFLPGRLFPAYIYLPLAFAAIILAAGFSQWKPVWLCVVVACWIPWNLRLLRDEQHTTLEHGDGVYAYVDQLERWARRNPETRTLVFKGVPAGFQHWGVQGAWNIAHNGIGYSAYFFDWPQTKEVLAKETVAWAEWDDAARVLRIRTRAPGQP
jgi:hypothetical protein